MGRSYQWPFQDPKLEVPTIYKAYFSGLCKGISPQNVALHGSGPPCLDPEIPIDFMFPFVNGDIPSLVVPIWIDLVMLDGI